MGLWNMYWIIPIIIAMIVAGIVFFVSDSRIHKRSHLYICALAGCDLATMAATGRMPDPVQVIRGIRAEGQLLRRRAERIAAKLKLADINAPFFIEGAAAMEALVEGEIKGIEQSAGRKQRALELVKRCRSFGRSSECPKSLTGPILEWSQDSKRWCHAVIRWAAEYAARIRTAMPPIHEE